MKTIHLTRQNHNAPDISALEAMRSELRTLLTCDWSREEISREKTVKEILEFQEEKGGFALLDSYRVPSDARVDFCYEPTYLCTAILMKALLEDKDILSLKGQAALSKAMQLCCARNLQGHGSDGFQGMIDAIDLFISCDVKRFLAVYPELCPEFTKMFRDIEKQFSLMVGNQNYSGLWREDYEDSIKRISKYLTISHVFVYGTLMMNQSNHFYIKDCRKVGNGTIRGYEMFDLGSYPGIVRGEGAVPGEVYEADAAAFARMDRLEGEGTLYIRTQVTVELDDGGTVSAAVYVYNMSVSGCRKLLGWHGVDYVWYVAYGSNLLEERLRYYIQGGYFESNGREYEGCADKSLPVKMKPVLIPGRMYYANYDMGVWRKSAICFFDPTASGRAYGRAYLIKRTQLDEIHRQEGKGKNWYPFCIQLEDIDGHPAFTFAGSAGKVRESFSKVSPDYGDILFRGMKETYPALSENEILQYLRDCGESLANYQR